VILSQTQKLVSITPPQAIVDNASWTTSEIDTLGYDYVTIYAYFGAMDIAMVALKVTESDTSGSGHADVTGLVFGTSNNTGGSASTLPSATDDNKFFAFEIDMRGRKRYLDLVATGGDGAAGTYMTAWAVLERAEEYPNSASDRGCSQILRVPA
jgi:hypothetical protein